ncbi:MAG: hypothetical protein KF715_08555 [Candidatus Didemnitutus sp.]|nr:hypothetical protein [Candidatus Didemnitutus sp.]
MLSTILGIILALLRASPAVLAAVQERQRRERDANAAARLQAKDDAVDRAIREAQENHDASDAPKS